MAVNDRTFACICVGSLVAAVLAGCEGASSSSRSTTTPTPSPKSDESSTSWTMPDLRGSVLQNAQDVIQRLTDRRILVTTSHDATGRGRQQVVDSNWKVCSQNIAPGQTITADTRIDFGAVQLDERCP
jgi:hypothetical protein